MELKLDRLTKQFGSAIAVDRLSATLTPGVYGLLGANGAGKTTLMRMICDVLKPTSGSVVWNGVPIERLGERYRSVLGYLPQDFGYYPDFTALDFMLYLSALKGLDSKAAKRRSMELLDLVGLAGVAKRKVKTFSGGMKQRLGIAQAVINVPQVLVLDEPTAGLDPKERVRFRNLISALAQDKVVILSTHIVSDVEYIAHHARRADRRNGNRRRDTRAGIRRCVGMRSHSARGGCHVCPHGRRQRKVRPQRHGGRADRLGCAAT